MTELEIIKLARAAWTPLGIAALVLILLYFVAKLALQARVERRSEVEKRVPAGAGTGDELLYYNESPPPPPPPPSFRIFKLFWILALVVAVLAFAAFALPSFFSDTNLRGVVVYESTNDTVEGARVSVDGYPQLNYVTQKDGNFLITISNRQRQDEYRVRAWLSTPPATLVGNLLVADGDALKKSLTVTLKGGPNPVPSSAGKPTSPSTSAPSHRAGKRTNKAESSSVPTATNQSSASTPEANPSSDFEPLFKQHQGDELQLARLGEQAFSRLDYPWTIKFLEQAKRVQASKVWESDYPVLAAAYLLGDHDRDRFKRTLQEMLAEMRLNNSYLHHTQTIGFALQNLSNVRQYLDADAQAYIDNVVVPGAIQIKSNL